MLKIAQETMRIAVLQHFRSVENYAQAKFPQTPLSDETSPNIRNTKRTGSGQIKKRIGLRPPPSALAIEGTPGSRGQMQTRAITEGNLLLFHQAPNRVDVGRAVG
jgi:hypothetical protein